jgi:hypothetical protein
MMMSIPGGKLGQIDIEVGPAMSRRLSAIL